MMNVLWKIGCRPNVIFVRNFTYKTVQKIGVSKILNTYIQQAVLNWSNTKVNTFKMLWKIYILNK